MSAKRLNELMKEAELLTMEEQDRLVAFLLKKTVQERSSSQSRHWRDIRGTAKPSLFGEDAQAYISRTRKEADESRAIE